MKFAFKELKTSARAARQQLRRQLGQTLDRQLLNLQHGKFSRWIAGWKDVPGAVESADLVGRIGQSVFARAQAIKESLSHKVCGDMRQTPRTRVRKTATKATAKSSTKSGTARVSAKKPVSRRARTSAARRVTH